MQDHPPQYIAASFDLPGPTFRSEMATDYKANRSPMPPDLAEQIPWVHEACEALGVPILTSQRFEADDVIGTLAEKAVEAGFEVAIVTGDKDFFQLVHDGIKVYNPKEDGTWFDAAGVKEKFGVTPEQVVDVLALMGDSIDNIKGVPGIGEKGARDLIATYGSLEALLAHAGEVSNKRYREGLLNARRGCAAEPRAGAHPHRRAGAVRSRGAALSRRVPRDVLRAVHAPRLPIAGAGVRADRRDRSARTTRSCRSRSTELRALADELQACGTLRPARASRLARPRCVAGIVGLSFSTAPRQRPLRADGRPASERRRSLRRPVTETRRAGRESIATRRWTC